MKKSRCEIYYCPFDLVFENENPKRKRQREDVGIGGPVILCVVFKMVSKEPPKTADMRDGEHPASAQRRARRESSHTPTVSNEVSAVEKHVVPSQERSVELEAQVGTTRATPLGTKMEVPVWNTPSFAAPCADVRHF
jgi:hypothetical protein